MVQNSLYLNYSKGNKYIMRDFINILEDKQLKKEIIDVVHATDDLSVLQKVLNTLKAGNIDERIQKVIGKDADAQQFIKKIIAAIINIDAPVEEKNAFLHRYEKGIVIDSKKLLDGKLHNFSEIVGTGFALELFKQLSVELVSQGVGPGEVALAVLSPEIAWSGRTSGGGDIQVNKKPVEVKTRVSKGGRWINARKADLDLGAIKTAMHKYLTKRVTIPARVNATYWVETIRPAINPKGLKTAAKEIADSTFKFVNNTSYQKALVSGDATAIVNAFLDVGYNNYKKYSGFIGMLLMDVPTDQCQYFVDYADMAGSISAGTTYLLAPESEMMPQVVLQPGGEIRAGRAAPLTVPDVPQKVAGKRGPSHAAVTQLFTNYAAAWAQKNGIAVDRAGVNHIAQIVIDGKQQGLTNKTIEAHLKKMIPALRTPRSTPMRETREVSPMRQRRT